MKNVIYLFIVLVWCSCTNLDRKLEESTTLNSQVIQSNYDPEAILDSLGISLRDIGNPLANYVHAARSGNLMFLAGKGPRQADGENIVGKLGQDLSVEEGNLAAREAGINQLSVLKAELGSLKKVKRIVSVHGMVNATADFTDHSQVINGYSDLMVAVFGNQGKHARAAIGMVSLPGNMAVEVAMVVEVYPE
ncbi:RidA family protein [Maribacter confluentis]|uniref:RidA family protein n=1 Tax=Maribacter confluentis TaxID=1656093 RepID=A0ABT8RQR2_9FLAO|nr:RidA family protein [Maribacter confluentis]MDO1513165.1 RidA family protein [Maribacter confluentis]